MSLLNKLRSPPRVVARHNRPKQVYTIHVCSQAHSVFTMQFYTDSSSMKSSIVAFREKEQAMRFGVLLESYHRETHAYPSFDFDTYPSIFVKKSQHHTEMLMNTELHVWDDNAVKTYCEDSLCDLLILTERDGSPDVASYHGLLYRVEYDQEVMKSRFQKMYDEPV